MTERPTFTPPKPSGSSTSPAAPSPAAAPAHPITGTPSTTTPPPARPAATSTAAAAPTERPTFMRPNQPGPNDNRTPAAAPAAPKPAAPARPTMEPAVFEKFSKLIYELAGIRFQENKAYFLASKLQARCQALGLDGFQAYWDFLQSPAGNSEYGHMVDAITINETFFYRNQPQLIAFETEVLKPLIEKRKAAGVNKIRIWSCACSTGDEPYTIALIVKDATYAQGMNFEIVGSDICYDAVQTAKAGEYRQYAVRNIPESQMQRFMTPNPNGHTFALSDEIKNMVTLQEGNLMDGMRLSKMGKFDIIFCRNVLIYFDDPSKEVVMKNLSNNLAEDGTVVMGHSENVYSQRHILQLDSSRAASISYVKADRNTPKRSSIF